MVYKNTIFVLILFTLLSIAGCSTWHSLHLETDHQPIQFGAFSTGADLDSLGSVSGFTKYEFQEATYSESENVYVEIGGGEYFEENLNQTLYRALEDDSSHFIANGRVIVQVKHGISFGAVLASMFANMLTGPNSESDIGSYSEEHIYYHGEVYTLKSAERNNE